MSFSKLELSQTSKRYPKTFLIVGAHSLDDYLEFDDARTKPNFFLFEADEARSNLMLLESTDLDRIKVINTCLSDTNGDLVQFHELPLGSSSILPPNLPNLKLLSSKFHQNNKFSWKRTTTLDSWLETIKVESPVCLIIDVQGAEDKIIKGAARTLKHVDLLIAEVSTREFYSNQVLYPEMKKIVKRMNFRILRKRIDIWNRQGDILAINKESMSVLKSLWILIISKISDFGWLMRQSNYSKVKARLRAPRTESC